MTPVLVWLGTGGLPGRPFVWLLAQDRDKGESGRGDVTQLRPTSFQSLPTVLRANDGGDSGRSVPGPLPRELCDHKQVTHLSDPRRVSSLVCTKGKRVNPRGEARIKLEETVPVPPAGSGSVWEPAGTDGFDVGVAAVEGNGLWLNAGTQPGRACPSGVRAASAGTSEARGAFSCVPAHPTA